MEILPVIRPSAQFIFGLSDEGLDSFQDRYNVSLNLADGEWMDNNNRNAT